MIFTKVIINQTQTHIVPELPAPVRLQEYGVGIFSYASTKSALKKALKKQYIKVNNAIATSATFIHGGESISFCMPQPINPGKVLVFPLEVLFEDEHLAIVYKPAGILVSGNSFKTVARALTQNLKRSNLPDATMPQPVHRLDYATTGVLLVGKTSSSIQILNKLFEKHEVEKVYYATTIGEMADEGVITSEIDGKASQSNYNLIKSVSSDRFGKLNLLKLKPQTGRRHQLRRHLSSIGNPILGDRDYGIEGQILKGKGLYLHAYSLTFLHPFNGNKVQCVTPLPFKFTKLFPQIT